MFSSIYSEALCPGKVRNAKTSKRKMPRSERLNSRPLQRSSVGIFHENLDSFWISANSWDLSRNLSTKDTSTYSSPSLTDSNQTSIRNSHLTGSLKKAQIIKKINFLRLIHFWPNCDFYNPKGIPMEFYYN